MDWVVTRGTSQSGEGTVHLRADKADSYEAYRPVHRFRCRNPSLLLEYTGIDHDRKVRGHHEALSITNARRAAGATDVSFYVLPGSTPLQSNNQQRRLG